ncbi:MAG TPA: HPr family phosphocarrier protein [Paracoccaceae bacterium]|nr:HPr family phosphocarrier protein [Paracoccaceae bacterium]
MTETVPPAAWVLGAAVIRDPTGLHARPAVKLTKLAKRFAARVEIRSQGAEGWVNAKSPHAVMKLRAGHQTVLEIRAEGADAAAAVTALRALVDSNFDEPGGN